MELGQILHTAVQYGFLRELVGRLKRARRQHKKFMGKRLANDKSHLDLMAELAPAMAAHYFTGTGWDFGLWEPRTKLRDVDAELVAPSGQRVVIQVKAPDEPEGYDERVYKALEHGREQIAGAEQPSMLVVCAQRWHSLAAHPGIVVWHLLGPTTEVAGTVYLPIEELGRFASEEWRHVGAVSLLEHLRGGRCLYTCTVLLNPWADDRVRCERAWFPRARVCWRDGEWLNWQAAPPDGEVYARIRIARRWWR